jgi:hypothetical protein
VESAEWWRSDIEVGVYKYISFLRFCCCHVCVRYSSIERVRGRVDCDRDAISDIIFGGCDEHT